MNKLINLTPHEVTILGGGNGPVRIPASGKVARVKQSFSDAGAIPAPGDNSKSIVGEWPMIRLVTATYGCVEGLPDADRVCGYCGTTNCEMLSGAESICSTAGEAEFPTRYIVSAMVRAALPARTDLLSPAEFERDAKGQIVGCRSLERNGGAK